MAIPATPSNVYVTQGNRQALVQWNLTAGATSYSVQRSLDGVTFAVVSTPTAAQYVDTAVTVGVQYWYNVASVNGSGTSPYSVAQSIVPTPTAEMSLIELINSAKQRADRVNSNFVTKPEWTNYINQSMYELYDLLITTYEDYFMAPRARFTTNGSTGIYPLPDGLLSFTSVAGSSFVAAPFYKLLGVDLGINTTANAFVDINKFNLIDRNNYVYPNSNSTLYGIFNSQYRMLGTNIEFIPVPTSGQLIQLLYIPRLPQLLLDTDITTIGFSGWLEYVIVKAAYLALTKEESDTSPLVTQLVALNKRIEESAMNRDAGRPDTISDVRLGANNGGGGPFSGFKGGW